MFHSKRKGPPLHRSKVECLFCHLQLNRDRFENHRKTKHENNPKCSFKIVTDEKQMKITFKSPAGPVGGRLVSGADVGGDMADQESNLAPLAEHGAEAELGTNSSSFMVSNVKCYQLLNAN